MKLQNQAAQHQDMPPAEAQLMARICWAYFKEGQTQEAIAQRMGITRKRVNRVLNDARASGFVQTTINSPVSAYVELEVGLVATHGPHGLRNAIVVPTPDNDVDVRVVIGAAAGQYLSEHLADGASLGITWGGTINAAAQNILHRQDRNNTVVLMCGGLARSTRINPYDNAAIFARTLDATCYYMTAPMFAETVELREALVASEPVRSVLEMARHVDMALLSATDLSEGSKLLEYEVISREIWQSLRDAGATGDICGHYLDAGGNAVAHPLVERTINPTLADLRAIPELILAAGGMQKVPVIESAIRAGLVRTLITDEATAAALL
ncbi:MULTISPECIES: sugar-binding transcriptional regulator [Pandoraea]|uniref:sugar-binding transcriptional regulator n=1 Tax=Pandoraea TaxID=93217 RepID=UPI001F5C6FFB|nr:MULTISPECIES: sugar-binding transcriptional regulator [Pandoraea]MCI3207977.1 transcriptional regulator [Pandoraea sp. LA3]MDN4586006.1 transcriptional regulator [Pandoraea capi]